MLLPFFLPAWSSSSLQSKTLAVQGIMAASRNPQKILEKGVDRRREKG
jgi:hypothetical protein